MHFARFNILQDKGSMMDKNLFGEKQKEEKKKAKDAEEAMSVKQSKKDFPEPESFESALEELENLVNQLDTADIQLEESVELYVRAQFLASWCQDKLDKIEGKLKILLPGSQGKLETKEVDNYGF